MFCVWRLQGLCHRILAKFVVFQNRSMPRQQTGSEKLQRMELKNFQVSRSHSKKFEEYVSARYHTTIMCFPFESI